MNKKTEFKTYKNETKQFLANWASINQIFMIKKAHILSKKTQIIAMKAIGKNPTAESREFCFFPT